ncbi:MAG: NifU family protein [Bacteroidia bacterium]
MTTAQTAIPLTIYAEATPNPETLKFVLNKPLVKKGIFEFDNSTEAKNSPLAEMLFGFSFVKGVFIMNNFISVTKDPAYKWVDLIHTLRQSIKDFVEEGTEIISQEYLDAQEATGEDGAADEDNAVVMIKQILNSQVKPAVEMDGGFIEFKSFEEGKVTLILRGACSGCPSSTVTLKAGIEGLLKRFVPEVKEVVAEAM